MQIVSIVLAAGKGSRMKSSLPKVLHKIGGAPLIWFPLNLSAQLKCHKTIVVTNSDDFEIRSVAEQLSNQVKYVKQICQNGTATAVLSAEKQLANYNGKLLILFGDVPFLSLKTITKLLNFDNDKKRLKLLAFNSKNPKNYGRLIIDSNNFVERVVEEKDASNNEKKNLTM